MTHSEDERLPPELQDVARTLRAQKPEATALELDRIKRRAMTQASRATGHSPQKGMFMKSRGALLTVLVMGTMLFGTGATLAATGNLPLVSKSTSTPVKSAQDAQYPGNGVQGKACGQQVAGQRRSSRRRTRSRRRAAFTAQANQPCPPTAGKKKSTKKSRSRR
jgi:hypothetical protein